MRPELPVGGQIRCYVPSLEITARCCFCSAFVPVLLAKLHEPGELWQKAPASFVSSHPRPEQSACTLKLQSQNVTNLRLANAIQSSVKAESTARELIRSIGGLRCSPEDSQQQDASTQALACKIRLRQSQGTLGRQPAGAAAGTYDAVIHAVLQEHVTADASRCARISGTCETQPHNWIHQHAHVRL